MCCMRMLEGVVRVDMSICEGGCLALDVKAFTWQSRVCECVNVLCAPRFRPENGLSRHSRLTYSHFPKRVNKDIH